MFDILGLPKKLVDVIFVMGSSDPKAKENFDKEKDIVNKMIDKPKNALPKYGVIHFGDTGTVKVPLGDYEDEDELKDRVKKLPLKQGKSLDEGIKSAGEEFEKNGRPKARQVMVVFIDGNDDSTKDKFKKVAKPLKKKNVKIVPVLLEDLVDEEKIKPLLGKKKKPVKGKDPSKLVDDISEETLNGKFLLIFCFNNLRMIYFNSFPTDGLCNILLCLTPEDFTGHCGMFRDERVILEVYCYISCNF